MEKQIEDIKKYINKEKMDNSFKYAQTEGIQSHHISYIPLKSENSIHRPQNDKTASILENNLPKSNLIKILNEYQLKESKKQIATNHKFNPQLQKLIPSNFNSGQSIKSENPINIIQAKEPSLIENARLKSENKTSNANSPLEILSFMRNMHNSRNNHKSLPTKERTGPYTIYKGGDNSNFEMSTVNSNQTSDHTGIYNVKNCENVVKTIGDKISMLKISIIKSDTNLRINVEKLQHSLDKILHFMGGDIIGLFKSCKLMKEKLIAYIKESSIILTDNFFSIYSSFFEPVERHFVIKQSRSKNLVIDLIFKCRIVIPNKYIGQTVVISEWSKFVGRTNILKNIFKFDYISSKNKLWIMKENTTFNADELNKAYVQPIIGFAKNDIFQITFNLMSERGILDFSTFQWKKINFIKSPSTDHFELKISHKNKDLVDFDLSRICELELIKNNWVEYIEFREKQVKIITPKLKYNMDKYIECIKNELENIFVVKKVLYDDIGYMIAKIYLIATQEANCFSKNLGINIIVRKTNSQIWNELKKNGLIYDNSNTLELRAGDEVILYISKNK